MRRESEGGGRPRGPIAFRGPPPDDPPGTGLWLLEAGLWPVVVTPPDDPASPSPGKAPVGSRWGRTRPTARRLERRYRRHPRAGVGVLLGPAGGVVDFEVDDEAGARGLVARLFPGGPPRTLGWRSARGGHLLFRWDPRLEDVGCPAVAHLAGGAAELRAGGAGRQLQSVCPPSPTADGRPRAWNGVWEVAGLPDALLAEVARETKKRLPLGRVGPPPAAQPGRYADAALRRELALVRAAPVGARNETLNRAGFNLGQLAAAGLLDPAAVEALLVDAALDCGLDEGEARRTARSGLAAGARTPRSTRARSGSSG